MAKAPAFQFFAGDRAMDLMGLDNEAVGAWTRAMMYLWTTGPTPEDRLANVAGKGWERVRFLFGSFEAGLSLEWMEELREKQRVFRENAAKNGARGGRPSRIKKGTLTEPKPKPNPKQRVGSMKIEEEVSSSEKERARVIVLPWPTPSFEAAWQLWKKYKAEKGARYKPIGEQSALVKLSKDYPNEQAAIAAMEYSMAQNYQGIFPPKKDLFSNGSPKHQTDEQYRDEVARVFAERQANRDRLAAERASAEAGG